MLLTQKLPHSTTLTLRTATHFLCVRDPGFKLSITMRATSPSAMKVLVLTLCLDLTMAFAPGLCSMDQYHLKISRLGSVSAPNPIDLERC